MTTSLRNHRITWCGDNHGYNKYTHGCRCDVCKAAKADYMRAQRAAAAQRRRAAQAAGQTYIADGTDHGLSGYRDHSCRCPVCVEANTVAAARETRHALTVTMAYLEATEPGLAAAVRRAMAREVHPTPS